MLSNELMGAFCLGVVWLNTALIVMHVLQARAALGVEAARLGTVLRVRVTRVEGGAEGAGLAEIRVGQRGRAITTGGPDRILFTQASRTARVAGGEVEAAGEPMTLRPSSDASAWALHAPGERQGASFDETFAAASTNRGVDSELRVVLGRAGDEVWVAGEREGSAFAARVVADEDPRRVLASGRAQALAFALGALVVLGGVTALALVRPWFSGWSTLGGVLAVGYFLGVQPLAVSLREAIAVPAARLRGGIWQRS